MWWLVGLVLLSISIPLLFARCGLPVAQYVVGLAETKFFGGESIFAKDFMYAREVTWLQWPALGVGVLEELPASNFVHFIEFAIPLSIYCWGKYFSLKKTS
jgi:hypothetical protein